MKTISIFGEPKTKGSPLTSKDNIKVVYDETGEDITNGVKSISFDISVGGIATAKLEFFVSKVDLKSVEMKDGEIFETKDGKFRLIAEKIKAEVDD